MNKFKHILPLLLIVLSSNLFAQKPNSDAITSYDYHFKINGIKDTTIILAQYYGNRLAYRDTAQMVNGELTYKQSNRKLNKGIYALVLPYKDENGKKVNVYFDFFVDENKIDILTDIENIPTSTIVKKSDENKFYYNFIKYISTQKRKANELSVKIKSSNGKEKEKYEKELNTISADVAVKQNEYFNSDMYVSTFLKMSKDVDIPKEAPAGVDSLWQYQYYLNHYFDNFDFADDNILNSIIYYNKLDYFFQKAVAQVPDSIIRHADILLSQIPEESESYKYIVNYLSYKYETSKVICMDAVFVHMAMEYYAKGKVTWLEKDKMDKIIERGQKLYPISCNQKAPRLLLPDTTEKNFIDLYSLDAEYTVIVFWEHSCGHCKKELPVLAKMLNKFEDNQVKVYAVETDLATDGWKEYLNEHSEMDAFINVSDNPELNKNYMPYIQDGTTNIQSLNFRDTYDVFSTPKVFLLNKDKEIVAKQIGVPQLESLLNYFFEQQAK